MGVSERQLRARLALDLDGAFPDLVRTHQAAVWSAALRWSGNRHDAEEHAQETFARAFTALSSYSAERISELRIRPWLLTIALNVLRNDRRRAGRRPATSSIDGEPSGARAGGSALGAAADPGESLEQSEALAALVSSLPEPYRLAVVLRHVVGLGYSEAASVLDCPVGTVKTKVSRGLDVLRRQLSNEEDTHGCS